MVQYTEWRSISDGSIISDIPDGAIHQWQLSEGSGNTASDAVGENDGDIQGPDWVSNSWFEGFALDGDGSTDIVQCGVLDGLTESVISGEFAIVFTVQTTQSDGYLGGMESGATAATIQIGNEAGSPPSGSLAPWVNDDNGDFLIQYSNTTIDDGDKYRCVCNMHGTDATAWEIWINAVDDGVSTELNQSPSNYSDGTNEFGWFDRGDQSSAVDCILDNMIIFDRHLTESEIENDYETQPWS